jgi:hypothetical protein
MNRSLRGRLPWCPPWLPAALLVVLLGAAAGGYEALDRHQGHPSGQARASAADLVPAGDGRHPEGSAVPGAEQGSAAQASPGQAGSGQEGGGLAGGGLAGGGLAGPQLSAVAREIRQSVEARTAVLRVVRGVNACTMTPAAGMRVVFGAIRRRERALDRLGALRLSAVPGGQVMSADLALALRESIAADQDFIGWMQDIQDAGCPVRPAHDLSYQAGLRASARASADKRAFLARWNRLARQRHQPVFTGGQI